MTERQQQIAAWVAIGALVAWSAYQRYQLLAESPFPLGIDGYFYPIQLRALLETGHLQYAASPLAFYWMLPFAAATDPITGAKLGAAIGGALIAVPMYGVGARLGGRGAGLVAAVLATTSAGSEYLSIEFVKNGIGLTAAMFALWAVLAACDRDPLPRATLQRSRSRLAAVGVAAGVAVLASIAANVVVVLAVGLAITGAVWVATSRRTAVATGAILAALLAHKTAAGLVLAIAAPAIVAELVARGRLRGRRLIYVLAAAVALVLAIVIAGVVAPRLFLSGNDIDELSRALSSTAQWTLPGLVRRNGELGVGHEALIGVAVAIVAALGLAMPARAPISLALPAGARVAAWAIVGLAFGIGLPWLAVDDPQGIGMRLRICAFVPMSLCAALAGRAVLASVARRDAILAPLAVVLALVMPRTPRTEPEAMIRVHPALASAVMALAGQIPAGDTVVVPERHIAFMVAWYTRAPVSIQAEPIPRANRIRLLPGAFVGVGANSPLEKALDDARREPLLEPPLGVHAGNRNGLVLVGETTWEWILTRLPERARRYYAGWPTI